MRRSPAAHEVARHFQRDWEDYDRQIRRSIPFYDQALTTLVAVTRRSVPEPRRMLDLGVGTGNLAHMLLEAFPRARLAGVDLARDFLEVAGSRLAAHGSRVSLHAADVVDFELEESRYDLIVTSFVFHHLDDENKTLLYGGVARALSKGGFFVNADFVDSGSRFWSGAFDDLRMDHMRAAGLSEDDIGRLYVEHRKFESPVPMETQLGWLRQEGFVDVECFWKYLNLGIFGGRRSG